MLPNESCLPCIVACSTAQRETGSGGNSMEGPLCREFWGHAARSRVLSLLIRSMHVRVQGATVEQNRALH